MDKNIQNRLNVLVKKTYYIYQRFKVDATFALLYHEKTLGLVELSKFIRMSDQVIQIDENQYFILFAFTSQENAYKASQNIIHNLDKYFNDTTSYIVLDSFDITKSAQNVLNRLKQIMVEARKDPYVRIQTEDILYM